MLPRFFFALLHEEKVLCPVRDNRASGKGCLKIPLPEPEVVATVVSGLGHGGIDGRPEVTRVVMDSAAGWPFGTGENEVYVIVRRIEMRGHMIATKIVPLIFLVMVSVTGCATMERGTVAREATVEEFAKSKDTKGIVILAINWGRRWNCGGYENAEIMSLGFDQLPLKSPADSSPSEIFLDGPPRLTKKPIFVDYALLLKAGEYALTSFDVKAARSVSDVGRFVATRSNLTQDGKPKVGFFQVRAGEIVYIGNFYLDCYKDPIIWRYYTEGRDAFLKHMSEVKEKYPFVDPASVNYRLFQTTTIGNNYELPK